MLFRILVLLLSLLASPTFAISPPPVMGKQGMVVSVDALASKVGVDILRAGGNAIDAAVAVGYALAVVDPCCGNIGGGGFMTLHLAKGSTLFINFRERAPLAATPNMFLDAKGNVIPQKSTLGYLAVGVPGTVLGLETALKKYGTLTRQQVMAPAIKLAEQGFLLGSDNIKLFNENTALFKKASNVAAIFLKKNHPFQLGDRLVQKDLSNTLKEIAVQGPDAFYKGTIAAAIVKASQQNGGLLSLKDFATYQVEEMSPLMCTYRGYTVISAPPPSSGGVTLCEMLNILENYSLKALGYHSAQSVHYIVEAMRYAFYDRNNRLGDPDFVKNPTTHLLSKDYATQIVRNILDARATPSSELNASPATPEGVHTTHYSVIDRWGNAVSVTYTLNSFFGAKVIAGNTGFFLNNEMDDFSVKVNYPNQFGLIQGAENKIQPGKRPLSSMAPTLVMQGKKVVMVVGSPGGPRIITATLETLLNVIDYGMDIQEAVDAGRFHHQWLPDTIDVEPFALSPDTMTKLTAMGYHFTPKDPWSAVEAIWVDPVSKKMFGGSDNRRPDGKAVAY